MVSEIRLLELMLYREAGEVGLDLAIYRLSKHYPEVYNKINEMLNNIRRK